MASRKFIPYSQPKNIPSSIITSYAQSKSISSSSSYLICPTEKYTQFKFHPHMPSQTSYLVQVFTFICPAKERTQLHVSSSYNQPKTIPSSSCLFALSRSRSIFTSYLMSTSIFITFMFIVPGRCHDGMFPLFTATPQFFG